MEIVHGPKSNQKGKGENIHGVIKIMISINSETRYFNGSRPETGSNGQKVPGKLNKKKTKQKQFEEKWKVMNKAESTRNRN